MAVMSADLAGRSGLARFVPNRLAESGLALGVLGLLSSALFLPASPFTTICIAAVLWGWSEANGLCGYSHICSLSMLRAWPARPHLWLQATSLYTICGLCTAAAVGAAVGLPAALLTELPAFLLIGASVAAVPLLCRELGWIVFPLPQIRRQTNKLWAVEFGFTTAAGMWGAHIGLGFATVIRHGGFLVLVPIAAAVGVDKAALLFVLYWLGRTVPIWTNQLISREAFDAATLSRDIEGCERVCRFNAAVGLTASVPAAVQLVALQ